MKNVFITGGSRGIGRSIVLKFIREGWGCAFTYAGNIAAADETIKLAKEINPDANIKAYQLELKDVPRIETVADTAISDFGDIHALINNAGIVRNSAAAVMSQEDWEEVIAVNLSAPFFVAQSFLMHFLSNRCGKILNISSLAMLGSSGQANYAAAKAGLVGLTMTLAKEYGPKGIRANILCIGYVPTDMTKEHLAKPLHDFWVTYSAVRREGKPEEIANIAYFLCSDDADFITGEVVSAVGGLYYGL